MTLGVLPAHVAARWAATRTPAYRVGTNESETEMTEPMYTREDLARAWDYGRSKGREEAALEANFGVIKTTRNPYEPEEA